MIDNASYHSKYSDDHPKSTWKKAQYAEWLKKRKIPYAKDALRPTLWKLAKEKRENYPAYRLAKIAYKYGHEIVRLPPYHCQLNPIELIWGILKKSMWHQKIKNINFQKYIYHVSIMYISCIYISCIYIYIYMYIYIYVYMCIYIYI